MSNVNFLPQKEDGKPFLDCVSLRVFYILLSSDSITAPSYLWLASHRCTKPPLNCNSPIPIQTLLSQTAVRIYFWGTKDTDMWIQSIFFTRLPLSSISNPDTFHSKSSLVEIYKEFCWVDDMSSKAWANCLLSFQMAKQLERQICRI